ncbi:hypothetical protein [Actinopolymorpha alba]|uniref:hypothetical protein n=1 Tax=Actinopolymorpha alba TaxID=533267 RepID=UPI000366819B|nr:hypothetical protein [Actinopolymorpha alba]
MATWVARVEWHGTEQAPSDDDLETIAEALAQNAGSVGREREPDRVSATVAVEANSLRQAIDGALRVVRYAVQGQNLPFAPHGVEVLDENTFARRLTLPSIPPLVGYAEIARMADVSRQRAQQLSELPGFPPAVPDVPGPLRVRSQVETWLSKWERKPGRPRKA